MSISRRKFLKMTAGAVGGTLALTGGYLYFGDQANYPALERVQIPLKNLPAALRGLTIVYLSDFHLHPFTEIEGLRRAVLLATQLQPDLIVLGGDYVTHEAEAIFELAPVLASLNARYGVFATIGNHDIWTNVRVVKRGLTGVGLPILVNEGLVLDVGGAPLYLAGLDDAWSGRPDLPAAMANWPAGAPVILLAHEPDPADFYAKDNRVSLQLSGHSHGGQIRLPGRGAFVLPHLAEKYDMGLYRVNDTWLYTSRGLGNVAEPLRLNCAPEVTEFTLINTEGE